MFDPDAYITDYSEVVPGDIIHLDEYFHAANVVALAYYDDAYSDTVCISTKSESWNDLRDTDQMEGLKIIGHVDNVPKDISDMMKFAKKILEDY